jgi:hypothetical protein
VMVNYEPRPGQAVGRVVMQMNVSSLIVRPDETKGTTKLVLLDAIGPDLAAKGLKVGDIVLPSKVSGAVMNGGASFRPIVNEQDILLVLRNWTSLDEFRVQTESGSEYVAFNNPKAAPSLGFPGERASTSGNGVEHHP